MPFSETTPAHTETYWTEHFERYLKPILEEDGRVEVERSKPLRGDVRGEIIRSLLDSGIVVVDLTDSNPNVFWELGVRQSFAHCTVTIAEKGYRLPFDISSKGVLFYGGDQVANERFRNDLKAAVADCLTNPKRPDSFVLQEIGGRGSLFEIIQKDQALRRIDALRAEYATNLSLMQDVLKHVKDNPGLRTEKKETSMPSARFLDSCAELLLVDRYLEENHNFYQLVLNYIRMIRAWNDHIVEWPNDETYQEKWFTASEPGVQKLFAMVDGALEAAQERVRAVK